MWLLFGWTLCNASLIRTVYFIMIFALGSRILTTVDPLCLAKVSWNFGFKGGRSVLLFQKRMKQGI
ncbi:MAG: hypothetical protein ACOYOF_19840, partial [Verrucomicrobiaceae bacterium]